MKRHKISEVVETETERRARLRRKVDGASTPPPHPEIDIRDDEVTDVIDLVTQRVRMTHKACTDSVRDKAAANSKVAKG
jgi:hypothetical protein